MSTTATNFVYVTGSNPVLNGATVSTPPFLDTYNPKEAMAVSQLVQPAGGSGSPSANVNMVIDRVMFDPGLSAIPNVGGPWPVPEVYGGVVGNFAKNGSVLLSLSGTTAQSVDLTNTTANSPASSAGDTTFSNINLIIANNIGTHDLVLSPGAANPARLPEMGGTTPTITVPAGSYHVFHSAANLAVDGTHKIITVTPSAGGTLALTFCGS